MTFPYSPERVAELLSRPTAPLCPTIGDRKFWEALADSPLGAVLLDKSVAEAKRYAENPPPPPTFGNALDYHRTGNREAWQNRGFAQLRRLSATVLAACFTNDPQWIDEAADAIWAIGELSNWVLPAHRRDETDDSPGFDLGAAGRGQEISEALQILAPALDQLSPRFRQKLKRDLHERVFTPYLTRDYWFTYPQEGHALNNWTAVCSGGALVAALAVLDDEPELQAKIVAKAIWSLGYFVDVFGEQGSLDEGVGYWSYGVSNYVIAAERLFARTGGEIDLLAHPRWKGVARFPLQVNLYGDNYATFSDCAPRVAMSPGWLMWMGHHLDLPEVQAWAARRSAAIVADGQTSFSLSILLRDLLWQPEAGEARQESSRPLHNYLSDIHWFFARTSPDDDALILAAKGGHNAENHNHNDGGSFVIHYKGESLVDELGAPTYNLQFFGPDRYQNIAARSLGHSVPLVNGVEQHVGRQFEAKVLEHDTETFRLDLTNLYPDTAGVTQLTRLLKLDRSGDGAVELVDEAHFENENGALALPLMVLGKPIVLESGTALIQGRKSALRVQWNPEKVRARVETVPVSDVRFQDEQGASKISQLWLEVEPVERAVRLELVFTPVD